MALNDIRTIGEERGPIAKAICAQLLLGRHCIVYGPDLVGKTPLLMYVCKCLNDTPGVVAVRHDLSTMADLPSWSDALARMRSRLMCEPQAVNQEEYPLSRLIAEFLSANPSVERLVLVFQRVDHLPPDFLRRFAHECSTVLNTREAPFDRLAVLWAGNRLEMSDAVINTNVYLRFTRTWTLGNYDAVETADLFRKSAAPFHYPLGKDQVAEFWRQTGGHPSLVRPFLDSYARRLLLRFQESALFGPNVEIIRSEADAYAEELNDLAQRLTEGVSADKSLAARIATTLVLRIGKDSSLLDLMAVLTQKHGNVPPQLRYTARQASDIFDCGDRSGTVSIRGLILDKFLRRYFSLRRIGLCYLLLDEVENAFGKGVLWCQLANQRQEPIAIPSDFDPVVAAMSVRMHRLDGPMEILRDLQLLITHVLSNPRTVIFRVSSAKLEHDSSLSEQVGAAPLDVDSVRLACSFAVTQAISTARACSQNGGRQVAIPIDLRAGNGYLLWVDGRDRIPDADLLGSVVRAAEGPLASAVRRNELGQQLSRREEELRLLFGLKPISDARQRFFEQVVGGVLAFFDAVRLRARIDIDSVVFGGPKSWETLEPSMDHNRQVDATTCNHDGPSTAEGLSDARSWSHQLPLINSGHNFGALHLDLSSVAEDQKLATEAQRLVSVLLPLAWESGLGEVYRYILDFLPTGVQLLDPEFHIVQMNKVLQDQLRDRDGYTDEWHGQYCWRVHRAPGTAERCSRADCTPAIAQGRPNREARRIETWPHRLLGSDKRLWHLVHAQMLPGSKEGEISGYMELSRQLTVGEVFAHLSGDGENQGEGKYGFLDGNPYRLFDEKDPDRVCQLITLGALMLGFDRVRLYWQDPASGLLTSRACAGFGSRGKQESFAELKLSYPPKSFQEKGRKALEENKIMLVRCPKLPPTQAQTMATVIEPLHLPYEISLGCDKVKEVAVAPMHTPLGVLGALAVDYALLGRSSNVLFSVDDLQKLGQYAELAASIIHSEEMHQGLAHFMAHAGHTLLKPMSVIGSRSHALFRATRKTKKMERHRDGINTAIQHLTRMVRNIVLTSSGDSEESGGPRQIIDMASIVENCVNDASLAGEGRGVKVMLRMKERAAPIAGDEDRLAIALANLLDNAIASTEDCAAPEGGHRVIVTLSTRDSDYELRVADTGCGIPDALRTRIWEPFLEASGRGSGLGLNAARAAIQFHDGQLALERSVTGENATPTTPRGTTFLVSIPRRKFILIVDDDVSVSHFASKTLDQLCLAQRLACIRAGNAESAKGIVSKFGNSLRLAFVDLHLNPTDTAQTDPERKTGIALCRTFQARGCQFPLVVWTGCPSEPDVNACRSIDGVAYYMEKPLAVSVLVKITEACLLGEAPQRTQVVKSNGGAG